MNKPKHLVRGLFAQMDTHQKVFVIHTIILAILLLTLPIISLNVIQDTTLGEWAIKFFHPTFWKSDIIFLLMIATIMLITFHTKVKETMVAIFGVTDVFVNFVCYMVIVGIYIGIGDATMAVHLNLTQTISLASWYYIVGIWLAIWLILHASWSYKYGKQAHQSTIINLAAHKGDTDKHNKESFKNLFD